MSSHKNGGNPISGPLNFLRSSAREILGKNPSNGPSPVGSPVLGKSEVVSAKSETEALCSGWMKMRHPMKKWVSRWFVLRQGILVYYRDEKTAINPKRKPSGAILLADTEVREDRISKDGMFSLKIEHLHNRSVFKTRPGFKLTPSLRWNWNYCVLRIASESSRKTWITAIIPQIEYATSHRNAIHFNISQDDESDFEDESDHEGNILPNSPKLARQAQPSSLGTHVITANTLSPPVQINLRHSSDVASQRSRSASANEMQPSITLKSQSVEDIVTDPNLRGELSTTQSRMVTNLHEQQRKEIQQVQDNTMITIEKWKNELSVKMTTIEGRITRSAQGKEKEKKGISLGSLQLCFLILFCMLLGRLTRHTIVYGDYTTPEL